MIRLSIEVRVLGAKRDVMGTCHGHFNGDSTDKARFWPRMIRDLGMELYDTAGNNWIGNIDDMSGNGVGIATDSKLMRGYLVSIAEPMAKAGVVLIDRDRAGLAECK